MAIKYGCGVFYAYLALVPAGLMKLLSAIGFISDKELGEQYLTEVFQSDTIRAPQAALVLCTYYLFLPTGLGNVKETLAKAKVVLDRMNEKYPNNSYFWGYLNFYHRKQGHTVEAVEAITRAADNAEKAGQKPTLLTYLLGDTLYMDLQFEKAKLQYERLLEHLENTGETFAYTGQVVISLAACYVMLKDDETALRWLKRVQSMFNPKSKQDANSPKYAARVLKDPKLLPLMPIYVLYINRDLAHMNAEHVAKLRAAMLEMTTGRDVSTGEPLAMYQLFDGVMFKVCEQKEEAAGAFKKIFDNEKKLASDSLVLPYAYYEMGEMEYRSGNYQEAKAMFEKGAALKGDGHETLANRYAIAQKQLKREMKEKGLA
jgi:tetratricopeptide (TPR) repeat protein